MKQLDKDDCSLTPISRNRMSNISVETLDLDQKSYLNACQCTESNETGSLEGEL